MHTSSSQTNIQEDSELSSLFPRLSSAIDFQESIVTHGKITAPIVVALLFAVGYYDLFNYDLFRKMGGWVSIFGLIGLAAYWFVYVVNKDKIESLEKSLTIENSGNNQASDISNIYATWLKFGAPISFLLAILSSLAVLYIIGFIIIAFMAKVYIEKLA